MANLVLNFTFTLVLERVREKLVHASITVEVAEYDQRIFGPRQSQEHRRV